MLYKNRNAHGGDIYSHKIILDYSVSLNPLGTPESVIGALKNAASKAGNYPDPYCTDLVKAIACSEGVSADQILCSNGGAEMIYAFCSAVKPKKPAICIPSFSEYESALKLYSETVLKYRLDEQNGFQTDKGILDFIRQEKPDLLFLCNPNNPDGRLIPDKLLDDILKECEAAGCPVFLDECFLDLSEGYDNTKVPLTRQYPNLFILKAFTKNYSLAGVRLGYGICSDEELLRAIAERMQPWNVSVLAQEAGLAALKEADFVKEARNVIRTQRRYLSEELKAAGLTVYPSEANYILIRVPEEADADHDTPAETQRETDAPVVERFGEMLLKKGILIRRCDNFDGLGRGWYRVCVKRREENEMLIKAVKQIRKGV